jgi:O-acetylhomoserine/O-acetylserine sulfhydrylase-like pyridoxal-dependent enzyme
MTAAAPSRAYCAEILLNPKLDVFPIKEVADSGRSLGVPLIADDTATPFIARPFEHGAGARIDDSIPHRPRSGPAPS